MIVTPNTTLLECLGFPARESTSRDLLAWAIKEHGMSVLAPILGKDAPALLPTMINTEHVFANTEGRRDRIDLLIDTSAGLVGIEVKVHSGAGVGQLERYARNLGVLASGRPAWLVFLTETGVVPEYPRQLQARHSDIRLVCATWNDLVDSLPGGDALGWRDSLIRRREELRVWETRLLGSGNWPPIAVQMTPQAANAASRGVLALATAVASKVGVERVFGPVGGDYYPDPQVDLAKATWTTELGFRSDSLKPYDPLATGDLRFGVRARFRMNTRGALTLGIGTVILPYPPHTAPWKKVEELAQPSLEMAWRIRDALRQALGEPLLQERYWWSFDHTLISDWNGDHVEQATVALQRIIPKIDEVLDRQLATRGPA
jgi:hypothetical protein